MNHNIQIITNTFTTINEHDESKISSIYTTSFKQIKNDFTFYTNRLIKLLTLSATEQENQIDYNEYDMFSIIDVYASWCACLSDLQTILKIPYDIPNLFSTYNDPRC